MRIKNEDQAKLFEDVTGIKATGAPVVTTSRVSSKAILEHTMPLDVFVSRVRDGSASKSDYMEPTEGWLRLKVDDKKLVAPNGVYLNDFAVKSLAGYTEIPLTLVDYFMYTHPDLNRLAYEMNWGLDVRKAKLDNSTSKRFARKYMMRNRLDDDGNKVCRVVVTDQYAVLNNIEVLDITKNALPSGAWNDARISSSYDNGDDIMCDIILPDWVKKNQTSEYGIVVALKNSEVTKYTFVLEPGIFEANTKNTYIWTRDTSKFKLNIKHRGDINRFTLQNSATTVIQTVLTEGENLITQLNYLKDIKVTNVAELIFLLAKERSINKRVARLWYKNYRNLFGKEATGYNIISALSHTAKAFEGDDKRSIEATATTIMTPSLHAQEVKVQNLWGAYNTRSKEIDMDDLKDFLEDL